MTEIRLDLSSIPFNLDHTLGCGQVFRWEKKGEWWYGVIGSRVVKVKQAGETLVIQTYPEEGDVGFLKTYFRLDDDLTHILTSISKDSVIKAAIQRFYGLRIIRQNPWECLVSYICATNANIPAIQGMLSNLCKKFGDRIEFEENVYFTFPTPSTLARAKVGELEACGLGYRSDFVIATAQRVFSDRFPLDELSGYDYKISRERLLAKSWGRKILPGVGPKVADCVLLFSLDKLEAFPIDVWIQRAVLEFYPHLFEEKLVEKLRGKMSGEESLGFTEYERIAERMRNYFGKYAGYAQEYLYTHIRSLH